MSKIIQELCRFQVHLDLRDAAAALQDLNKVCVVG